MRYNSCGFCGKFDDNDGAKSHIGEVNKFKLLFLDKVYIENLSGKFIRVSMSAHFSKILDIYYNFIFKNLHIQLHLGRYKSHNLAKFGTLNPQMVTHLSDT